MNNNNFILYPDSDDEAGDAPPKVSYEDSVAEFERLQHLFRPATMRAFLASVKDYAVKHFNAAKRSIDKMPWPEAFRSNISGKVINAFFAANPDIWVHYEAGEPTAPREIATLMHDKEMFPMKKGRNRGAIATDVISALLAAGVDLSGLGEEQLAGLGIRRKPKVDRRKRARDEDEDEDDDEDEEMEGFVGFVVNPAVAAAARQCAGNTKAGARCKRQTRHESGFCPTHQE